MELDKEGKPFRRHTTADKASIMLGAIGLTVFFVGLNPGILSALVYLLIAISLVGYAAIGWRVLVALIRR
jgi:nitrogen fixation-related uncharacterized protein